jgi:hypothetical protein
MDMMSLGSLAGSVFSTVCTAYFWFVKVRRERPLLRSHLADREFFLGNGGGDTRQIGVKVGIVVANCSLVPNALLGAQLAVRGRRGQWFDIPNLSFDKQTPLPFNIPTMQTVLLRLNGTLTLPALPQLEEGSASKILQAYLQHYLADPREIRIQLHALSGWQAKQELPVTPHAAAA